MSLSFTEILLEQACAPYRAAGQFAWHFARGKLSRDPAFVSMLKLGLIPPQARILDIGCGQGLLASWLLSAQNLAQQGRWESTWANAPKIVSVRGIDLMPKDIARAQAALGEHHDQLQFETANMCNAEFGQVNTVVILDVLHYVDYAAQDDVLQRLKRALLPQGTLLLRVGDAAGGLPFKISNWVDALVTRVRGHRNSRLYCRSLSEWQATLSTLGFQVKAMPMSQGTPFANVLLVCTLAA